MAAAGGAGESPVRGGLSSALAVTRPYWDALPGLVRDHLRCPVVDTLVPIRRKHTIDGPVMGAE
ncbi:hypothetical protein [Micromonospora sp. NPDC049240]|uniref:hypothetical protein n=1 Tax=Micromonospora sp. NPDC049240 TaxID=3155151 RepID=UPI0033D44488